MIIAVDSTRIKITVKDQWMNWNWNVQMKVYQNHVSVNIKTKEIFVQEVTNERLMIEEGC